LFVFPIAVIAGWFLPGEGLPSMPSSDLIGAKDSR
jgi:hypothetical protein